MLDTEDEDSYTQNEKEEEADSSEESRRSRPSTYLVSQPRMCRFGTFFQCNTGPGTTRQFRGLGEVYRAGSDVFNQSSEEEKKRQSRKFSFEKAFEIIEVPLTSKKKSWPRVEKEVARQESVDSRSKSCDNKDGINDKFLFRKSDEYKKGIFSFTNNLFNVDPSADRAAFQETGQHELNIVSSTPLVPDSYVSPTKTALRTQEKANKERDSRADSRVQVVELEDISPHAQQQRLPNRKKDNSKGKKGSTTSSNSQLPQLPVAQKVKRPTTHVVTKPRSSSNFPQLKYAPRKTHSEYVEVQSLTASLDSIHLKSLASDRTSNFGKPFSDNDSLKKFIESKRRDQKNDSRNSNRSLDIPLYKSEEKLVSSAKWKTEIKDLKEDSIVLPPIHSGKRRTSNGVTYIL